MQTRRAWVAGGAAPSAAWAVECSSKWVAKQPALRTLRTSRRLPATRQLQARSGCSQMRQLAHTREVSRPKTLVRAQSLATRICDKGLAKADSAGGCVPGCGLQR